MVADDLLEDISCALGMVAVPPFVAALAENDPDLLVAAWRHGGKWLDGRFFDEANALAASALDEVASSLPPSDDHVRLGGLGGSDLPEVDAALEGLINGTCAGLLLAVAWHRAVTESDFGARDRIPARPLCPGAPRFLKELPRPPDDGLQRAEEAARRIGCPGAGAYFVPLTVWPDYLAVATTDFERRTGSDGHARAVERVAAEGHDVVGSLASPIHELEEASGGQGAAILADAASMSPSLVVAAAFLRAGVPPVARIPRAAGLVHAG